MVDYSIAVDAGKISQKRDPRAVVHGGGCVVSADRVVPVQVKPDTFQNRAPERTAAVRVFARVGRSPQRVVLYTEIVRAGTVQFGAAETAGGFVTRSDRTAGPTK